MRGLSICVGTAALAWIGLTTHMLRAEQAVAPPSGSQHAVVALTDDFADGEIATNPTWRGGDAHRFNPFFVEKIGDRFWAGARRYGSCGAWLTRPDSRHWPHPYDAVDGPLVVKLLAMFRPGVEGDAIAVQLRSFDRQVTVRFFRDGRVDLAARWLDTGKLVLSTAVRRQPLSAGEPIAVDLTLSRDVGLRLQLDEDVALELTAEQRARLMPLLDHFERLVFLGALRVQEKDVLERIPQLQGTEALRWITQIRVTGTPKQVSFAQAELIETAPRRALVLAGPAAMLVPGFMEVEDSPDDQVRILTEQIPLSGGNVAQTRRLIRLEHLRKYQWVVLFDAHPLMLGPLGCIHLRQYVELGGSLLIVPGISSASSGLFHSPLQDLMPPMEPGPTFFRPVSGPTAEFALRSKPLGTRVMMNGRARVYEHGVGHGRVRLVYQLVAGDPKQPFWHFGRNWLDALTDARLKTCMKTPASAE